MFYLVNLFLSVKYKNCFLNFYHYNCLRKGEVVHENIFRQIQIILAVNNSNEIAKTICVVSAFYCFFYAALILGTALALEARRVLIMDTLSAGVLAGIGIALVWEWGAVGAGILQTLIAFVLPWVLIAAGSFYLLQFIVEVAAKVDSRVWFVRLVSGAALLTIGIILWINHSANTLVFILLGVAIVITGVLLLIGSLSKRSSSKR